MRIDRLHEPSEQLRAAMNRLMPQLSATACPVTIEHLDRVLSSGAVWVFGAFDGATLAGMLSLIVAPIPTGFHGYIEDVVVDEAFRGRGIAEKLVRAALDAARQAGAEKVDLTSNPSRDAANRLYLRIGFQRRETNVYRYSLK